MEEIVLIRAHFFSISQLYSQMHKRGARYHIARNISKSKMWESTHLMHALQALVANFEAFDDFYLNLHELNIVNLVRDGVS